VSSVRLPDASRAPRSGEVVLALDVGEARIGVARGEVGSPFAFGRGTLPGGDDAATLSRLRELVAVERAGRLIVGLPLRTDGRDSAQTTRVRTLAARLDAVGVPVELVDERFTTQAAQRALRGSGLPRGKRRQKGRLDEASAVLILEGWLARHAPPPERHPGEASE
jgi:putative holliday junction resolvase